jgi:hypothetical protein
MIRSATIERLSLPVWSGLVRALLVGGWLGLLVVAHAPTHLVSALGRLLAQPGWIDAARITLPAALDRAFWLPPALLTLGLALRNRSAPMAAERPALGRRELLLTLGLTLSALAIRIVPLWQTPWIKPDYDEGVYLGGAWLLRDGALPYRDFVFPHLPGALLLLWPAAQLIQLWQDNTTALLAARLTAALADGVAVGLIYCAARQLTATPGALLASLVYASDTLAIHYSRGVRLEPLQAPWLIAGALLTLVTLNQPQLRRRWAVAAGVTLALGVTVKITGALVPIAALLALGLERRWRALADLGLGLLLGGLAICGWCLATSGDEIVRQTVLLQLQRSQEYVLEPFAFLLSDRYTALTALAALLGCAALLAQGWRGRVASGWLFVLLWLSLTLLLFAAAASFYNHYYTQLVAPLALLAGAAPTLWRRLRWPRAGAIAAVALLAPLWWGQAQLWSEIDAAPAQRPLVDKLAALPTGEGVLLFDPIVSVLAGRPISGAPGQPYMLDAFLGDPYLESGLNRRWSDVVAVRRALSAQVNYMLVDAADATKLPWLWREFICDPLSANPNGLMLCSRADQPATIVQVGPQLELLRRTSARIERGADVRALVQPLHWRAPDTPGAELALALHLTDAGGNRVAQLDVPVNGGVTWQPDVITTLDYRLPLPATLGPGRYRLTATVYSWADGQVMRMQIAGQPPTDELELPPVTIAP